MLVNGEEQYSFWPKRLGHIPKRWRTTGTEGTRKVRYLCPGRLDRHAAIEPFVRQSRPGSSVVRGSREIMPNLELVRRSDSKRYV